MRILVTGSRDWWDKATVRERLIGAAIKANVDSATVVAGDARGADAIALWSAKRFGWPWEIHRASWGDDPTGAGFSRNRFMVNLGADVCLAFLLPCNLDRCRGRVPHSTHGTSHCLGLAETAGIPVVRVKGFR